ncbi:MAG: hypothetical protein ACRYHA_18980 [Janthinobacterium lividum]
MAFAWSLLPVVLATVSPVTQAGLINDVPSCYAANKIQGPVASYDKLVYLLIDQTVLLDPTLQKSVLDNMLSLLQPGTKFVVAEFSAFSQERYLQVLHTGIIETGMPASQEGDVVMGRLNDFKACMKAQAPFAQRMALTSAHDAMAGSASTLAQSDVMLALKTVSDAVRQDSATKKVVFVVTDGLENSSITSFYAKNAVRGVNPDIELNKARTNQLIGDFGGARVYILGGGLMAPPTQGTAAQRNGYRDPKTLLALKQFWSAYFSQSNARLVEFGAPALVESVGY